MYIMFIFFGGGSLQRYRVLPFEYAPAKMVVADDFMIWNLFFSWANVSLGCLGTIDKAYIDEP